MQLSVLGPHESFSAVRAGVRAGACVGASRVLLQVAQLCKCHTAHLHTTTDNNNNNQRFTATIQVNLR